MQRLHMRWVTLGRVRKWGAVLIEPHAKDRSTPEGFYYEEQGILSDLHDRCVAHGVKFKEGMR